MPATWYSLPEDASKKEANKLHRACRLGNLEDMKECLSDQLPVDVANGSGETPLHSAALAGSVDTGYCMG